MRRTTSKQHVWPRLPKANTTVCCSSCIGLDSRVISNRGGQPPEMSRGRAMSGSQYQCFWQSHFATALSFQGVLFSAQSREPLARCNMDRRGRRLSRLEETQAQY